MKAPADAFERAAELRERFDRAFASPPPQPPAETEELLLVRVGGDPYAIRLREIAGLIARRTIVPIPSAAPGMLGLAGIRGEIVPVFGLSSILGYPPEAEPPGWLLACGSKEPIAFGVTEFEGNLRLASSCVRDEARVARGYSSQIADSGTVARPIIDLPLVVAAIRERFGHDRPKRSSGA
jgi:chemotaxis signal transduction protein